MSITQKVETYILIIYKYNFNEYYSLEPKHEQKINRIKFKKDMPTLGLDPNTCSLRQ